MPKKAAQKIWHLFVKKGKRGKWTYQNTLKTDAEMKSRWTLEEIQSKKYSKRTRNEYVFAFVQMAVNAPLPNSEEIEQLVSNKVTIEGTQYSQFLFGGLPPNGETQKK